MAAGVGVGCRQGYRGCRDKNTEMLEVDWVGCRDRHWSIYRAGHSRLRSKRISRHVSYEQAPGKSETGKITARDKADLHFRPQRPEITFEIATRH